MKLVARYLLLLAAPLFAPTALMEQAAPSTATLGHREVDLAITYTSQRSDLVSKPTFWLQGGGIELSTQTYCGLGLAANAIGTEVGASADSGSGLTVLTTTFGPRYTWYRPMGASPPVMSATSIDPVISY